MAKFKVGDSIVPTQYAANYERIVIGTTSNGRVVYEYRDNHNSICIGDAQEDTFKLKPTKKEGYLGIMETTQLYCKRWETGVYNTPEKVKELTDKMDSRLVAIAKVEWEE